MRLGRLFIMLALVLVVGGAGLFFLLPGLGGSGGDGEDAEPEVLLVDVVWVEQFIPRGGTVSAAALGLVKIPANEFVEGIYFTDPAEVEGARARYDLLPGVFLSSPMILASGEGLSTSGSDTSLDIQPGMVAIAIPIDRFSSVAYGLQRGDHVNIIVSMLFVDLDTEFQTKLPNSTAGVIPPGNALLGTVETEDEISSTLTINEDLVTLTAQSITGGTVSPIGRIEIDGVLNQPFYIVPSESSQRPRLVSQTIMQDVIVIHVGDFPLSTEEETTEPAAAEGQPQPGDPNAQPQDVPAEGLAEVEPPDIITLMVSPQDAVTLNYLVLRGGHLTLVMRASVDDSRVFTEAVTLDWLLAQYNIPIPSRLPYGFEPSLERIISPAALDILDLILSESEN